MQAQTASAPKLQVRPRLIAFFENNLVDRMARIAGLFGEFRQPLFDTGAAGARLKQARR